MAESILHFPTTLELLLMLRATVMKHYLVGLMMCWDMTGHATMDEKILNYRQSLHHNICSLYKLRLHIVYKHVNIEDSLLRFELFVH